VELVAHGIYVVDDMGEGRCRKRYEETMQLHSRQGTLSVDAIEVVYSVADSDN